MLSFAIAAPFIGVVWSLDYDTANDPTLSTPLTESQRAELYSELASGAESGETHFYHAFLLLDW
jgi:hypothetical protein